ncbi:MAG: ribosome biogenesis/translation initiation ATPase RLI [Candidatus Hodarchaeales archaeon]
MMKKKTVVIRDRCSPDSCNYRCINLCPVNITGKKSRPVIVPKAIKLKGNSVIPTVIDKHCINCGVCVNACFRRAIKVVNVPGDMTSWTPTHEYFDSGFRLYGLPVLNQGIVTGIIGQNGIGKSTLLSILAGKFKPNAGVKSDGFFNKFLEGLSTPGMARFLSDVSTSNLKVAFKEQNLNSLKQRANSARELFNEIEIENPEIIDIVGIRSLLDKKLDQTSGGELQRIAIARTLMQPADIYLLDEPATYLDVKQRLLLAKLFKLKEKNDRYILVVEHDISVLDYWSDLIHILWGEPHVYGVVSRALSVKKGLNSFLTGWLKEENIHFRPRVISFKRTAKDRDLSQHQRIEWPEMTVNLGDFTLDIEAGQVYLGEIVTIIGENGLGKTTFANVISGKLPGFSRIHATISFKPQQITKDFDISVEEFLRQTTEKYLNTKYWQINLLKPLGIAHFLKRQMNELSGGENQRVFIAACLARDADLYILDEPSAFLDALERTKIASVIRNQTKRNPNCAVVSIEHDIQLADFTGDRVMMFEGVPTIKGHVSPPLPKKEGMNTFLKSLNITFRRDPETGRARINKPNSQMDKSQKEMGEYYYSYSK